MRPVPPTLAAAALRCLDRADRAASGGDTLEAQYWQSAAATAQRRQSLAPAPKPSLSARLRSFLVSPTSGRERVA